ncbi:MAG: hypothetical protein NT023_05710 [Armatimonadetes bacterium]|nr:hypothetical protein [Armatimonadota bacterium]
MGSNDNDPETWVREGWRPRGLPEGERAKAEKYFLLDTHSIFSRNRGFIATGFISPRGDPAEQIHHLLDRWRAVVLPNRDSLNSGYPILVPSDPYFLGWKTHCLIEIKNTPEDTYQVCGVASRRPMEAPLQLQNGIWYYPGQSILFHTIDTHVGSYYTGTDSEIDPMYQTHCQICIWPEIRLLEGRLVWRMMLSLFGSFTLSFHEPARIRESAQKELTSLTSVVLKRWAELCKEVSQGSPLAVSTHPTKHIAKSSIDL